MKRIVVLCVFLLVFASAAFAIHPLIGKWKLKCVIGSTAFYDYVTITTVSTTTRKVSGYLTGLTSYKVTGYFYGNIVYLEDSFADFYLDGYYFTFQGSLPFKKHMGVCSVYYDFDAAWHSLATSKLSSSTTSTETRTLDDILNQKMLKRQAQLRERMAPQASNE